MRRSDPAFRIKSGMTAFIVVEIKIILKALLEKLRYYNTFKPFTCIFHACSGMTGKEAGDGVKEARGQRRGSPG